MLKSATLTPLIGPRGPPFGLGAVTPSKLKRKGRVGPMAPVSPTGAKASRPAQWAMPGRSRGRGAGVIGMRPASPARTQWSVGRLAISGASNASSSSAQSVRSAEVVSRVSAIRSGRSISWQSAAHCAGVSAVTPTWPSVVG